MISSSEGHKLQLILIPIDMGGLSMGPKQPTKFTNIFENKNSVKNYLSYNKPLCTSFERRHLSLFTHHTVVPREESCHYQ